MTIIDLAKETDWKDVQKAHKYFYSGDKNNYAPIFYGIRKWNNIKTKRSGEKIQLTFFRSSLFEDEAYYDIRTNKYSLSLRDWKEISSIPVSLETLAHYSNADILAHFLWEITFYGHQKDIKKKRAEINESVKEFKKTYVPGKAKKTNR